MIGKYINAPIIEAIFDIKVELDSRATMSSIYDLQHNVKDHFPKSKKKIDFKSQFAFKDEELTAATPESKVSGMIFMNDAETCQVQFRLDGFTMNVLSPYHSWEEHFPIFMEYWDLYKSRLSPKSVTRIATRFINRIEVPNNYRDLKEYFTLIPSIPNELPQTIIEYFTRINVQSDEPKRKIIISQAIESKQPLVTPFILDLDVYQDQEIHWENDEDLVSDFNQLRILKNNAFESSITDLTRKIINNE